jgi:hypothetical protein
MHRCPATCIGTRCTDQGTDGCEPEQTQKSKSKTPQITIEIDSDRLPVLPALDETMKKPLVYRKTLIGSYMTAMYGA